MVTEFVAQTLASTVVTTALVALLVFLFQNLLVERLKVAVKAEYDAKLESHKAQLAAANGKEIEILKAQLKGHADTDLEQFKSQLQVQAAQQNLKFSKLHERRVEAMADTHKLLVEVLRKLQLYTSAFQMSGAPTREEKFESLVKSYERLREFYVGAQLFLPRNVAVKVTHLESEYMRITNLFTHVVNLNPQQPNVELWFKLNEQLEGAVTGTLTEVQEEMRTSLGDPPAEPVTAPVA